MCLENLLSSYGSGVFRNEHSLAYQKTIRYMKGATQNTVFEKTLPVAKKRITLAT